MKFLIVLVLAVACNARSIDKRAVAPQNPLIWDALTVLRGGKVLTTEDILNLVIKAVPGVDYPINAQIPASSLECSALNGGKPGFYADDSSPSKCQVFHRCDDAGVRTDYLCGNGSLFNQITLVCDWFYNIDCAKSAQFVDYSNSRLEIQGAVLLDNQNVIAATGAVAVA